MAPPAREGLPKAIGVFGVDPYKGGCTWATIQVLVAATDRKVGMAAI